MKKASYYIIKDREKKEIQCLLCPHVCAIPAGKTGLCRVRLNDQGELKLINYGKVTAAALDPIEKKPLKRYMPGKRIFSLGTFGCNFTCGFCQNWRIAQQEAPSYHFLSPQEAVEKALELIPSGNIGIAYTYSEPLMWFEYVLETAKLAQQNGLKNILVTNGYINSKPLKELLPYLDAVNLDIKSFSEGFYHDVCQGELQPVLNSAKLFAEKCHLEITTLLVPGLNDSTQEIKELASWIASIDERIPLHLSRYFPNYRFSLPPTPVAKMHEAKKTAELYLRHVFLGNVD